MRKKSWFLLLAAFVICGTILFLFWRRSINEREAEIQSLQAQLSQIRAEKNNLTRNLAEARNAQPLSKEQWNELMRLRSENGQLRQKNKELEQKSAILASRITTLTNAAIAPVEVTQDTSAEPQMIRKEDWQFKGYATADNAFESVLWAMRNGNIQQFQRGVTEETFQSVQNELGATTAEEFATKLMQETQKIEEIHLDQKKEETTSSVTFVLQALQETNGNTVTRDETVLRFEKSGDEWKLHWQ